MIDILSKNISVSVRIECVAEIQERQRIQQRYDNALVVSSINIMKKENNNSIYHHNDLKKRDEKADLIKKTVDIVVRLLGAYEISVKFGSTTYENHLDEKDSNDKFKNLSTINELKKSNIRFGRDNLNQDEVFYKLKKFLFDGLIEWIKLECESHNQLIDSVNHILLENKYKLIFQERLKTYYEEFSFTRVMSVDSIRQRGYKEFDQRKLGTIVGCDQPKFEDLEYSKVLHEKRFGEVMKDIVSRHFILKNVCFLQNKSIKGINHE